MHVEELRSYCLSKTGVMEDFPFGPEVMTFKLAGKIFLLCPLDEDGLQFNVKYNPERAVELRDRYPAVMPGYHMNKKHWNTVLADGSVSDALMREWIDHSYELVLQSLSQKQRAGLL